MISGGGPGMGNWRGYTGKRLHGGGPGNRAIVIHVLRLRLILGTQRKRLHIIRDTRLTHRLELMGGESSHDYIQHWHHDVKLLRPLPPSLWPLYTNLGKT
jgi:hypothetical protein